ncbi:MAG: YihA family ribosome biogenesis GTP-binding protein [Bacteroidetes bacterium]|nr:YihA family ribosome biogenesis GTP-binding protein [Bacteroidota bacterium]MBM3937372.1 YihA family ribosome biogenesis GTP-binding protein [Sphingomonadales bacterium]
MEINTADYIGSWQKNADMPHTELPEFAFIGRSNVGKSSLINMLTQRNGLAKTSSTPGKTQSINLFLLNKQIQFVDLPGYGYAKVSKDQREVFGKMIKYYLRDRVNLFCLFVLVDLRIKPQAIDLSFINECGENGIPMALIGTKADKLKVSELAENKAAIEQALLEVWEELPPFFISSSETKAGREEIWNFIKGTLPN